MTASLEHSEEHTFMEIGVGSHNRANQLHRVLRELLLAQDLLAKRGQIRLVLDSFEQLKQNLSATQKNQRGRNFTQ